MNVQFHHRDLHGFRRQRTTKHGSQLRPVFYLSVFTGILGTFLFGFSLGVLNTAMYRVSQDLHFSIITVGSLTFTLLSLGAIPGALFASLLADRLGPKRAMALMDVVVLAGALLDSTATTPGHLLVARFVTGAGIGGEQATVPRYIVDIAPSHLRGRVGSLAQMSLGFGVLVSCTMGLPFHFNRSFTAGNLAWWRVMLFFPGLVALLQVRGKLDYD